MHPAEIRKKRDKTPDEALAALMRLCARAEKSEGDARRLMRGWGVAEKDAEQVLGRLVRDRFIDDSRYAEAFVREKLRLSGWGINGGITNGNEIVVRAALKPTPSIGREQITYNLATNRVEPLEIHGRHDVCVALRGAVVVEAAVAIALANFIRQ